MLDREKVIKGLECCSKNHCAGEECPYYGTDCDSIRADALALLKEQDEQIRIKTEIVRCKNCMHRPKEPNWKTYGSGFDIEFPEGSKCPCQCSGDGWYSWYPEDNWYCADGERKQV